MTVPSELNGTNPTDSPTGGVNLPLRVVVTIPAFGPSDPSDETKASKVMYRTITITRILGEDTSKRPKVVSIQRLRPGSQTVASAFLEEKIPSAPFNVRIVLSEKRKGIPDVTKTADELAKDLVEIDDKEGAVSNLVIGTPFERLGPLPSYWLLTLQRDLRLCRANDSVGMARIDRIRVRGCTSTDYPK